MPVMSAGVRFRQVLTCQLTATEQLLGVVTTYTASQQLYDELRTNVSALAVPLTVVELLLVTVITSMFVNVTGRRASPVRLLGAMVTELPWASKFSVSVPRPPSTAMLVVGEELTLKVSLSG